MLPVKDSWTKEELSNLCSLLFDAAWLNRDTCGLDVEALFQALTSYYKNDYWSPVELGDIQQLLDMGVQVQIIRDEELN